MEAPLNICRIRLDAAGKEIPMPPIVRPRLTPGMTFGGPMTFTLQNRQIIHDQYVSALLSAIIFGTAAILAIVLLAAAPIC